LAVIVGVQVDADHAGPVGRPDVQAGEAALCGAHADAVCPARVEDDEAVLALRILVHRCPSMPRLVQQGHFWAGPLCGHPEHATHCTGGINQLELLGLDER